MDFFLNYNILFFLLAYLIGGIPFGLILSKKFANINIKEFGSQSIGATNVLRVVAMQDQKLAKKLSLATLILDALKGMLVLLVAMTLGVSVDNLWGIAIVAILGHCYSPYLGFEGGKGVATAFGVLMVLIPLPTLVGAITWAISAKLLRISSLSSLIGLIAVLIAVFLFEDGLGNIGVNTPLYIISFIILYKHIPNLIRLFERRENQVL